MLLKKNKLSKLSILEAELWNLYSERQTLLAFKEIALICWNYTTPAWKHAHTVSPALHIPQVITQLTFLLLLYADHPQLTHCHRNSLSPPAALFVCEHVSWRGTPGPLYPGNGTLIVPLEQEMEYVIHVPPCLPVAMLSIGLMGNSMGEQTVPHISEPPVHSNTYGAIYTYQNVICVQIRFWIETNPITVFGVISGICMKVLFSVLPASWCDIIFAPATACTGEYVRAQSEHLVQVFAFVDLLKLHLWTEKLAELPLNPFLHKSTWFHKVLYLHWADWFACTYAIGWAPAVICMQTERTLTTYRGLNESMTTAGVCM